MNKQPPPTITSRELANQAMQANRAARLKASERGGPETEMEILLAAHEPPEIAAGELSCMSAGIAELMRRRRMIEEEITPEELIYIFRYPVSAWAYLKQIKEPQQTTSEEWKCEIFTLSLMLDKQALEQCSAWVTRELHHFFGLPEASPPEEPSQPQVDARAVEPDGGCEPSKASSPITDTASLPVPIPCDGPSGDSPSTPTSP
ncbi:MAG: hypothetical protein DVB22_002591 [Verrucomicrobia bacterium]|nr:MAG: hypothetical protein DVB22_002591 [Verrucomicrobiota bacterium]